MKSFKEKKTVNKRLAPSALTNATGTVKSQRGTDGSLIISGFIDFTGFNSIVQGIEAEPLATLGEGHRPTRDRYFLATYFDASIGANPEYFDIMLKVKYDTGDIIFMERRDGTTNITGNAGDWIEMNVTFLD